MTLRIGRISGKGNTRIRLSRSFDLSTLIRSRPRSNAVVGIPAKLNAYSEGKPNGIPG